GDLPPRPHSTNVPVQRPATHQNPAVLLHLPARLEPACFCIRWVVVRCPPQLGRERPAAGRFHTYPREIARHRSWNACCWLGAHAEALRPAGIGWNPTPGPPSRDPRAAEAAWRAVSARDRGRAPALRCCGRAVAPRSTARGSRRVDRGRAFA